MKHRGPNVVLVITDDQGYGDLGCTGNPWIRTPEIDRFHAESVRFADFHVCPLCTPTRGSLMTGRRPLRNGAWATCWGRSILRRSETTLADVFAANGYRTGMFGKWHLGDNYPYRPQDRGFETVVAHKGGGVGQTPDFWGNNYFDDTYFHNGAPIAHEGYCTDIWFQEAIRFIEQHRQEPFFVYLATNAPHSPYLVADSYKRFYADEPAIPEPAFYGMITNIDENFGRLRRALAALCLGDDTLVIFMTDNGSSGGCRLDERQFATLGYNAGMRGKKGSYYDGGHRVPLFLRWPRAGLAGPRDVRDMALDVDLLPTLTALCGLTPPRPLALDGVSLAPLLRGGCDSVPGDRVHFLQYRQSTTPPEKWRNAVMTRRWRLIGGVELYDVADDPGQTRDVASCYPDVVDRLRQAHEAWWDEVAPGLDEYCPIVLGNPAENPTWLTAMDVMGDVAWRQLDIALAMKTTGRWAVEVERAGRFRFSLRRWPTVLDLPMEGVMPPEETRQLTYAPPDAVARVMRPARARLKVYDQVTSWPVTPGATEATACLTLSRPGATTLEAWFVDAAGEAQGAYYVGVERLPDQ